MLLQTRTRCEHSFLWHTDGLTAPPALQLPWGTVSWGTAWSWFSSLGKVWWGLGMERALCHARVPGRPPSPGGLWRSLAHPKEHSEAEDQEGAGSDLKGDIEVGD